VLCTNKVIPLPRCSGLRSTTSYKDPAEAFNECLDAVHPRLRFTREPESENSLAFLDVLITHLDNGRHTTRVYRKPSDTNTFIKPNCRQDPRVITSSFKDELCRAHRFCLSPTATKKEIELVLNIFKDNGHVKSNLIKFANNYNPPSQSANPMCPPAVANQPAADSPHCSHALQLPPPLPPVVTLPCTPVPPPLLSTTAPGQDNDETVPPSQDLTPEDTAKLQKHLHISLPYVPHIAHQLKRTLTKAGVKTSFRAGMKLKDILCSANKTKLPPT
jgi:hypothetical protein